MSCIQHERHDWSVMCALEMTVGWNMEFRQNSRLPLAGSLAVYLGGNWAAVVLARR